jgi:hypothetical protein
VAVGSAFGGRDEPTAGTSAAAGVSTDPTDNSDSGNGGGGCGLSVGVLMSAGGGGGGGGGGGNAGGCSGAAADLGGGLAPYASAVCTGGDMARCIVRTGRPNGTDASAAAKAVAGSISSMIRGATLCSEGRIDGSTTGAGAAGAVAGADGGGGVAFFGAVGRFRMRLTSEGAAGAAGAAGAGARDFRAEGNRRTAAVAGAGAGTVAGADTVAGAETGSVTGVCGTGFLGTSAAAAAIGVMARRALGGEEGGFSHARMISRRMAASSSNRCASAKRSALRFSSFSALTRCASARDIGARRRSRFAGDGPALPAGPAPAITVGAEAAAAEVGVVAFGV